MSKVGNTTIYRDEGILTILYALNTAILNLSSLQWHKDEYHAEAEEYLTLDEIAEQMDKQGCSPPYMLINESMLEGDIYLWGNYSDKAWYKHGETRGYA